MITVSSVYSVSFHSDNLAKSKHRMIKQLGDDLLNVRQSLSRWTHEHILECCELSKYDYLTKTLYLVENSQTISNLGFPVSIPSYFYRNIQVDVYTAYFNRLDAIKRKMVFKLRKCSETHYYKRDHKNRKTGFIQQKGSVRKIEYESYETEGWTEIIGQKTVLNKL